MNRRNLLLLMGGFLAGCASKNEQALGAYPLYDLPQYRVLVGELVFINRYKMPLKSPHVEQEISQLSPSMFESLLYKRFIKTGVYGKITLILENFAITEEVFSINQSMSSVFASEAGSRFSANWQASLKAEHPNFQGEIRIEASEQGTIGKDATLNARERELYGMGSRLWTKFNTKFNELVPIYFDKIIVKS